MRLNEDEIDHVRGSFSRVERSSREVAVKFYDRLFEIAPHLRPLFPTSMDQQGTKLMSTLASIVARLHDHEVLMPMVADLGRRHVSYGVKPAHYDHVGAALLAALSHTLGEAYTPDVAAAWQKAFDGLARTMIAASSPDGDEAGRNGA